MEYEHTNYLFNNVAAIKEPSHMTIPKPKGGRVCIFLGINVLVVISMDAYPKYWIPLLIDTTFIFIFI